MQRTSTLWHTFLTMSTALALTAPAFARSQSEGFVSPRLSNAPPSSSITMVSEQRIPMRDEAATEADRTLNQHIRQALNEDTALAAAAQSVYIKTDKGEVTLLGSVATEKEKADISTKVQQVAGVKKLHNQLQMTPPNLRGSVSSGNILAYGLPEESRLFVKELTTAVVKIPVLAVLENHKYEPEKTESHSFLSPIGQEKGPLLSSFGLGECDKRGAGREGEERI